MHYWATASSSEVVSPWHLPVPQVPDWRALGRPSAAIPEAAGTEAAAVVPETGSATAGQRVDATADAGPMKVDGSEARPSAAAQRASTEAAATDEEALPEAGLPSQAASGLLPYGWWVARTAAAVRKPPTAEQHAAPRQGSLADDAAAARDRPGRSLVRVRLKMTGRGVAAAGAAVLAPLSAHAAAGSPDAFRLAGFITAPLPRGACAWAGATALCCASLFDRSVSLIAHWVWYTSDLLRERETLERE